MDRMSGQVSAVIVQMRSFPVLMGGGAYRLDINVIKYLTARMDQMSGQVFAVIVQMRNLLVPTV